MHHGKRKITRGALRGPDLRGHQLRKAVEADYREEELARKRLGDTPEARLRWVVAFAQRDLDALRPEERIALGYDLRALIPTGWQITRDMGPMADADLRKRQRVMAERLGALLDGASWELPLRRAYLTRVGEAGGKTHRFQFTWQGDEAEGIICGVVDLLQQAGSRLRACAKPDCKRPFIARKRQEFCSASCGQAVRNLRKKHRRTQRVAADHRTSG